MSYIYDLTDTWDDAGTTFSAIKMNVTNTASAAASKLVQCQIGGTDKFTVDKDGDGYFAGQVGIGTTSPNQLLEVRNSGGDARVGIRSSDTGIAALMLGDATNGSASYISYNNANNALSFATTTTERMRIDSSGNVGIGTSSPSYKLDISGNGQIGIRYTDTVASNSARMYLTCGTATGIFQQYGSSHATSPNALNINASAGNLLLSTASTERMRIDSSGNVGIGTTSPVRPLHVHTSSGDVYAEFTNGTTGTTTSDGLQIGVQATTNDAIINNKEASNTRFFTSGSERMRIDSSGNVGIGTTSPSSYGGKLNVADAAAGGETTLVVTNNNVNQYVRLGINADTAQIAWDENDILAFGTAATSDTSGITSEFMRITNAGNVGIGTTSPSEKLSIYEATTSSSAIPAVNLSSLAAAANDRLPAINWSYGSTGTPVFASLDASRASSLGGNLLFHTNTTGGTLTERMRIDSSGNLLVGTTSGGAKLNVVSSANQTKVYVEGYGSGVGRGIDMKAGVDSASAIVFNNSSGTIVGSIAQTTTATAYNIASDARLKENIAPADDAAALIDAIEVRKFDWKADGSHQRYGMVAQELLEVAPEAVSGEPEGDEMMGVDYSKLVPMLIKEIQSLRARVAQLEGE